MKNAGDVFPFNVPERMKGRERYRRRIVQLLKIDAQLRSGRQDDAAFDEILQLADIARPLPALQNTHGSGRNGKGWAVHAPRELSYKVFRHCGDALRPLVKRGYADWEDAQAVEQIVAGLARQNHFPQVSGGGPDGVKIYLDAL